MWAGGGIDISKWSPAGNAGGFVKRIGRAAVLADDLAQAFRELVRYTGGCDLAGNHLPDALFQLQAFDILRQIVKASDEGERVSQQPECRLPEAGCNAQPGLLAKLYHDPIRNLLKIDRQRGLTSRRCSLARSDLNSHIIALSQDLRANITPVEFRQQGLRDIRG